jgi:hypothetical protein
VDARDQLALLAKQTDAREKLNQLRVTRKPAALFSKGAGFKQLGKNDVRTEFEYVINVQNETACIHFTSVKIILIHLLLEI